MLINFHDTTPTDRYKLVSSTVIPRPIAWISTQGEVTNLAPFSYFTPLSSEPPTLIVSIGHKSDGSPKDTLRNLRENKKCVVSIIDETHLEAMHYSSKSLESHESEIETFNIPTQNILEEFPPVPKGVKVAYFCSYLQEVDLKGSKTIPTILQIEHLYLDGSIVTDEEKLHIDFSSIGRVGKGYASLNDDIETPHIP